MRRNIPSLIVILSIWLASFSPLSASVAQAQSSTPTMVNIPGTHQNELGCSGEWQPDCENTKLTYDIEDDVWQGTFEIQPNNDDDKKGPRYKVALNGSWGENYGLNATPNGPDIPLVVPEPTLVKFYYDNKTHWIADNFNNKIVVAMGDFQKQIGCFNNNDATCLRAWMEDPDGDGVYSVTTPGIKAGTYTVTFTLNEDASNVIGKPQQFTVAKDGDSVYFGYDSMTNQFTISTTGAPVGNLNKQRAIWINKDTILWKISGNKGLNYALIYSADAALEISPDGILNGTEIPLNFVSDKPDVVILRAYPYLRDYAVFKVTDESNLADILKGQVAVVARNQSGKDVDATGIQIPGVLDDLYHYAGPLGVTFDGTTPTLRVWAPTAQQLTLYLYDTAIATYAQKLPMQLDPATGVWSITGDESWKGKYYLYEVKVFAPTTGKIENNLVTDPYSISLSMNSTRSQIVDLNDADLKPQGWDALQKPPLAAPEDIVIYELHIRDFSISDRSVPEELRGTYKAFTIKDSDGMKHLKELADAGLTHIHLLPAFDIASVNEDKSTWQTVNDATLASYPPDSDQQSIAVSAIMDKDGFNWGYDPLHYTTPDGSYATDPNGTPRIVEFRDMVQALNESGLRVVMDVVYNHTRASGQNDNSVLDRVVPGYYHRLNTDGNVEKATCCEDTATEHAMMRKLMIDSVITWAKEYKIDGFRFDLMGFHMLDDMKAVRAALDALTLEKDGVDGKSIYIYGEGWDFGEVANNARGKNASQLNIAGTGIGVFNDRIRDAVRGGSPFSDVREQGFATGLVFADNANESRKVEDQQVQLNNYTDWIRLSLAGNLADYKIVRADGKAIPGRLVAYNQSPAAYTSDPQENINYVSAHDNQTIFDAIQVKAPVEASLADRIRMNNLALSVVMFGQGVPFFHAGDDILRSKSFDPNSYNSGDWYNRLDWTYTSDNFGVGLPINGTGQWDIYKPLLANPKLAPTKADITFASAVFREFLQIRRSSPLFRLQTAKQIEKDVSFLNTGPKQTPGLIVMRLHDAGNLDANYKEIVVFFNARPDAATFSNTSLTGDYVLHPIQQNSADDVVKRASYENNTFNIPGRTTVVFVVERVQPTSQPTAKTPTTSAQSSSSNTTTVAGIVTVLLALLGVGIALRRRQKA